MLTEVVERSAPARVARSPARPLRSEIRPAVPPHPAYDATRRALDLVLAPLLLIAALPLLLAACLAIAVTQRQSPLLLQRRVGWLGREFTMLKLRSMRGEEAPPAFLLAKPRHDARVTAVGRFLRRTSIDELPQLVNVIAGQMTLVGPRPALPSEVALYRPAWLRRLSVRPGLTGLWQVSGRAGLPPSCWMALDRCYLARRSLAFDLRLLARTVAAVLSMRGAW